MTAAQTHQLLAMNRAEELGYDVWNQFVLPPFYESLAIGATKKPRVIIGGRGCGKTMLLRYLSHESTFSANRHNIPTDALSHVGLYWRADTQFASLMQHRDLNDDTWAAGFRHLAAIVLGAEVLRSVESIAASSLGIIDREHLPSISFQRLQAFSSDLPDCFQDLLAYLEDRVAEFEVWVNDVRSVPQPRFLPGKAFVKRIIELIHEQVVELRDAVFFVYIDEYENLAIYQQEIMNTWLKHSEPPLIFNLAMKRNGFKTRMTEGDESLSSKHDYRRTDLEDFDLEAEFPLFAAEILLLRLRAVEEFAGISAESLRDASKFSSRKEPDYISRVLDAATNLFPSLAQRELAIGVLGDSNLRQRLVDRIAKALKSRKETTATATEFVLEDFPEATVVVPALLHRKSLSVSEVLEDLSRLRNGEQNRFTGTTDWIHNNFIGCYLQVFEGLVRPCPFYGGFLTFCFMSRGNLRHFLELCHQALTRSRNGDAIGTVSVEHQSEAARQVAADLLAEVRSFGSQGNNLHTFLLRLGSLFSLSQQRPTQSEPERTHFTIQGGDSELDEGQKAFLSEAIKWSVLFEEKETKRKSETDPEGTEYVANPIYAPYFHISYRKRRKLELSASVASTLISGSYDDVKKLLKDYQRRWSVDLVEAPLPLFAHLDDEND